LIAVVAGIATAVAWAVTALSAASATRVIGAARTLAWVMLIGLIVDAPFLVATRPDLRMSGNEVVLVLVAGIGNVVGLGLEYRALRRGSSGIVTSIVSTEGAVAAAIAIIAGERVPLVTLVALGCTVLGVTFVTMLDSHDTTALSTRDNHAAAAMAIGVAILFGLSVYASGRLGQQLPLVYAVLPARIVGTILVTLPLAIARRLRSPRGARIAVVTGAVGEVAGIAFLALGARHALAVTAVIASLFPALVSVVALFLFGERLTRLQVVGIAFILVSAGVVAATAQG
jgi:drug/metabolite transporter (DMT)-like permease